MLENKELYRIFSREANDKWGAKEAMNTSDSWLYHKFSIGSREEYNTSSRQ